METYLILVEYRVSGKYVRHYTIECANAEKFESKMVDYYADGHKALGSTEHTAFFVVDVPRTPGEEEE